MDCIDMLLLWETVLFVSCLDISFMFKPMPIQATDDNRFTEKLRETDEGNGRRLRLIVGSMMPILHNSHTQQLLTILR